MTAGPRRPWPWWVWWFEAFPFVLWAAAFDLQPRIRPWASLVILAWALIMLEWNLDERIDRKD